MSRAALVLTFFTVSLLAAPNLQAQQAIPALPSASPQAPQHTLIPLPALPPGVLELLKLEGDFADAVSKGGGKAFSSWFADDAVTLNTGQPAVLGRIAIDATADWDPKNYQLTWFAEGAQMGPSNDAGFTWGHYDAVSTDKDGKKTTQSGRYLTFWKKVNGKWKVALDASANEPIDASLTPPAGTPSKPN
jgi:ketosteroid isomerase-like protein